MLKKQWLILVDVDWQQATHKLMHIYMGGDLAQSFWGWDKNFAKQIFEWPFLGKKFHFNAQNFWWPFFSHWLYFVGLFPVSIVWNLIYNIYMILFLTLNFYFKTKNSS